MYTQYPFAHPSRQAARDAARARAQGLLYPRLPGSSADGVVQVAKVALYPSPWRRPLRAGTRRRGRRR